MRQIVLVLAAMGLAGCGYAFSAGGGRLPAGAERIFVRPLENRTTDAEAGALMAAALRQELARRSADGDPGSPARLEGAVLTSTFTPSTGTTYLLTLQVEVRLVSGERQLAETRRSRQEVYIAGTDPLESEGRRRTALRRAALALARELVESLEVP